VAWQPLAFFSRQLCDNKRKYSTFDRELLGLFLATRRFTAFVDHKPLTFAIAKTSEPCSGRQQRQLSSISDPGVKSSTKLVGAKFLWPGLRKDVKAWAGSCVAFQPCERGPGGPAAPLPWVHSPSHYG